MFELHLQQLGLWVFHALLGTKISLPFPSKTTFFGYEYEFTVHKGTVHVRFLKSPLTQQRSTAAKKGA